MKRTFFRTAIVSYLCACSVLAALAQEQLYDAEFDAKITKPAYPVNRGPKVLFDEAHFNVHVSTGTYKPFVDLLANDGFRVIANKEKFSNRSLKGYDILVIANALGAQEDTQDASLAAFTEEECEAVKGWVQRGGSLLLIADHNPAASAAEALARRFHVEMSRALTYDETFFFKPEGAKTFLEFSKENALLGDHPIVRGRNSAEGISRVVSFAGQSLKGPPDSIVLLRLSPSAMDLSFPDRKTRVSAAGRSQALAMRDGKGRVVVAGEAGMFTAQVITEGTGATSKLRRLGMNTAGAGNRQFTLNIVHWLSGILR